MKRGAVFAFALVAPLVLLAVPNAAGAAEEVESPFLLQEHGKVRILRGLNPDRNFEPATLPKDVDLAPAAAEPVAAPSRAEPRRPRVEPDRKTTRQLALERVRERGITVNRAGVRRAIERDIESTRQRALQRHQARGITVNPAGG